MAITDVRTDALGHTRVDLAQAYDGVPVWGGGVHVHLDAAGEIVAVSASVVPAWSGASAPSFDDAEAGALAVAAVSGAMWVESVEMVVFDRALVTGGTTDPRLAFHVVVGGPDVRHEVFVDAHTGLPLLGASLTPDVLERRIYDGEYGPAFELWHESDGPYLGGDAEVQQLIDFTQDTYELFDHVAGGTYPSFDGVSAPMEAIVDAVMECPNAQWDGTSTNYCSGLATDDVVGHEWAHAYSQFNHALIYAYQPGALNEAYSDIFGEAVDLLNGAGLDSPGGVRNVQNCSFNGGDSVRWLIGEETVGFGGAIRDMWAPTCLGQPGRVGDFEYLCSGPDWFDNGGVHFNSGVPNHGFSLLVDGGNYNGVPVAAIGMTKALAIYWRAMTVYQDVTSSFADHADALAVSCADLMNAGTDLPNPVDGTPSGEIVTMSDCMQVGAAMAATEMADDPGCGNGTLLDPGAAPQPCGGEAPTVIFEEDFETDLSAWTLTNAGVAGEYVPRDWEVRGDLPAGRAGQAAFGTADLYLGDCFDDNQSGVMHMDAPAFTMPEGDGDVIVELSHWVATQPILDGGNLKVSIDGGPFELIPGSAFTFNAYNATLSFSDNPLAGQAAFTGSDPGVPTGSWAVSQIDLGQVAAAGEQVVLRFDVGVDDCNGLFGWYVDDVRVLQCAAAAPGTTGGSDTGSTSTSTDGGVDSTSTGDPSAGTATTSVPKPGDDSDGGLPPAETTGGLDTETDTVAGDGGEGGSSDGCGCTQAPSSAPAWLFAWWVIVGLGRRRRARPRA